MNGLKRKLDEPCKARLYGSISLAAMASVFLATPGLASAQPNMDETIIEEVVVTASRVERSGFTAPTPTTVIGAEDFQRKAAVNVMDVLNEMPSFRPSTSLTAGNTAIEGRGQLFADLRGLGGVRTLLLVDAHRMTPTNSKGQVDLNFVPTILVERAEVVTGGASAAWGSDAVAGVVNLILKSKLEGVQIDLQHGRSSEDDDITYKVALAVGKSIQDGRGHILFGAEYSDNEGVGDVYSRDWGREERGAIANAGFATNGQPATIYARNVRLSTAVLGGIITGGPLRGTAFGAGGTPYQYPYGQVYGNNMVGGGVGVHDIFLENIPLKIPVERWNFLGRVNYDFTPQVGGYVEVAYGANKNAAVGAPVGRDQGTLTIRADNPYLPASVRAQMLALGLASVPFGRNSTDFGTATYSNTNKTASVTAGLKGDLGGGWKWDAYAQYGQNQYDQVVSKNRIEDNWRRAIDPVVSPATGQIICRSTLTNPADGCVPLNLFGPNSASPAALSYILGTMRYAQETTQTVVAANVRGDPFSIWAGPVSVAAGVEYRKQTISATSDPLSMARRFRYGNPQPIDGDVVIKEGYLEVVAPILKDLPLVKSLDFNGAVRRTHYNTSGAVTTWKAGLSYALNDELRFRATMSRDIRAPNAAELFTSVTSGVLNIRDPISGQAFQTQADTSGNPNLQPEEADTFTAGMIYQPGWAPRLRMSVDYFDIDIDGQIATIQAQQIVDRCAAGASEFCQLVTRDATGRITRVLSPQLNLNKFKTRGVDFELGYSTPLSRLSASLTGDVSVRVLANYVQDLIVIDSAGAVDRAGETGGVGVPEWQATANLGYRLGGTDISAQWRYIGEGTIENTTQPTGTTSRNINSLPARIYTNLSVQHAVLDEGGRKVQLYGAVDNLLDVDPPFPIGAIFASNGVYYDVVGRTFRVGVRLQY